MSILVKWKGYEEPTWEPMEVIKEDDPVTVANYAKENQLLDKSKWKWARKYLKLSRDGLEYVRHLYSSKRKRGPKYKFGEQVPKSIEEAYKLDKENGTTGWADAIQLEIDLLMNKYQCFDVLEEELDLLQEDT